MFMHSCNLTFLPEHVVVSLFYSQHTLREDISIFVSTVSLFYQIIYNLITNTCMNMNLLFICNKYK